MAWFAWPDQITRLPLIDITIISADSNTCPFTVESVNRGKRIHEIAMIPSVVPLLHVKVRQ